MSRGEDSNDGRPTPQVMGEPTSSALDAEEAMPILVAVAVPLPIETHLTYSVPAGLATWVQPGSRVRVRVGPRRLVGYIVEPVETAPDGVEVRPIDRLLDRRSPLSGELLELARFVADYYLTPLGDVFRSMLPSELEAWGDRRVQLTDAGIFVRPKTTRQGEIVQVLRDNGPMYLSDLQQRLGGSALDSDLDELQEQAAIRLSRRGKGSNRYRKGYALSGRPFDELLLAAGRSEPGRRVVTYLHDLGRPADSAELLAACSCSAGVLRRLASLGVLQQFQQLQVAGLDDHVLARSTAPEIVLRSDQAAAADRLFDDLENRTYAARFLQGITGAGKTEVYLRAIARALELGLGAIVLVPEIALVPALAGELRRRFPGQVAILHSALTPGERQQEWELIATGTAKVVLGPRSAVFAPVAPLGLLVVDEEQDTSYKQEIAPRYNARDLALLRAQRASAVAVVVSATPSFETRKNVADGKIVPLLLTSRVGSGELPKPILVDLKEEAAGRIPGEIHFSQVLLDEITNALADDEQIILLRNRRGYAPMLLCRACGEDLRCDACGLPRTLHRKLQALLCHYCGSRLPVPNTCPSCAESALEPVGAGTERVEERFSEQFPGVPVDVLDRDTVRQRGSVSAVLDRFGRGDSQVLIGTQMVSKGHHFPRVALAGVLSADTYLGFPDFRAVERTYNLLTQLAGRAGRGDRAGRVVVQTYYPEHYAIRAFMEHDDVGFAQREMEFRRTFVYPPFSRMVQILARDTRRERAESTLEEICRAVYDHPLAREVRVTGPAPAPLERLRNKWRFQLILRSPSGGAVRQLVSDVLPARSKSELLVDVDPYQLL